MELKSLKNYQIISIAAFFMSSLQPILMSSAGFDEEGTRRVLAYGSAILFWLFLAIGIVTQIIMYIKLKGEIKGAPGIFSFFKNSISAVFDVLCAVSLVANIVLMIKSETDFIGYLAISVFIFSFEMHCVLNGRKFNEIINKIREEKKQ
ncbi:MAG: hypothetical protein IJR60_00220 [Eubacterium sp.]|nr:hypothetical protein [Eubacterium sp.]